VPGHRAGRSQLERSSTSLGGQLDGLADRHFGVGPGTGVRKQLAVEAVGGEEGEGLGRAGGA